jgi:electron transfer flavoprotein alpha subunit
MAVLVVADHDNKTLRDTTTKSITAAQRLSGDVDVLTWTRSSPRRWRP